MLIIINQYTNYCSTDEIINNITRTVFYKKYTKYFITYIYTIINRNVVGMSFLYNILWNKLWVLPASGMAVFALKYLSICSSMITLEHQHIHCFRNNVMPLITLTFVTICFLLNYIFGGGCNLNSECVNKHNVKTKILNKANRIQHSMITYLTLGL